MLRKLDIHTLNDEAGAMSLTPYKKELQVDQRA